MDNLTGVLLPARIFPADAAVAAQAQRFGLLERKATVLGFMDCLRAWRG